MTARKLPRALVALCQRVKTEPAVVLADPRWAAMRAEDPRFLAKSPPEFRLELLRLYFAQHADDPWVILRDANGDSPEWPMWEVPAWEIGTGSNPAEEEGIVSRAIPLANGWTARFFARQAEMDFEVQEICFDDDEGHDDISFPLDRVLTLLFTDPTADARQAFGGDAVGVGPDGGHSMLYCGFQLFAPDGEQLDTQNEGCCFFYEGETDDDIIATLSLCDGVLQRVPFNYEEPRPLFARAPEIDESDSLEGRISCSWSTPYYVPTDLGPQDKGPWSYEVQSLAVKENLDGWPAADLVEFAWHYNTMSDLDEAVAKAIAKPALHKLLLPIYEAMLFGATRTSNK